MATGQVSPKNGKIIDLPANAPTIGTATAGITLATVPFTAASTSTGGPISFYRVTSNPDNITATGTTSPITVTGLTGGTSYTFTVVGVNPSGTGPASSASNSVTVTAAPVVTGGSLSSDATYYYRTFTSNGTLTVSNLSLTADYFVVAGGGGGGSARRFTSGTYFEYAAGGGGGAGGRVETSTTIPVNSYAITIGGGGGSNSSGSDTTFGSLATAIGGGGGGYPANTANYSGLAGGSGGGCGSQTPEGGNIQFSGRGAGLQQHTGGGATSIVNSDKTTPIDSYITNYTITQENGVGGGCAPWTTPSFSGGYTPWGGAIGAFTLGGSTVAGPRNSSRGGGAGWTPNTNNAGNAGTAATANTGSGGGGAEDVYAAGPFPGGNGGSGIVVIRYTRSQVGG